jgi:hypothetical protein
MLVLLAASVVRMELIKYVIEKEGEGTIRRET